MPEHVEHLCGFPEGFCSSEYEEGISRGGSLGVWLTVRRFPEGFRYLSEIGPQADTLPLADQAAWYESTRTQIWERFEARRRFALACCGLPLAVLRNLIHPWGHDDQRIDTVDKLLASTDEQLLRRRNFGKKSLQAVQQTKARLRRTASGRWPEWDDWADTLSGWRR